MANYRLNTSSPDIKQARSSSAITATSTVINGGTVKAGGGSDGTKLDVDGFSLHDQSLYGSQVHDGADTAVCSAGGNGIANQVAGNYTMQLVNESIHGVANSSLVGAGSVARPKINERTAIRTKQVALAIKAGHWNIFTGRFDVAPTGVNDFSSFGTDETTSSSSNNRGLKGEGTYAMQKSPVNFDYTPPTT